MLSKEAVLNILAVFEEVWNSIFSYGSQSKTEVDTMDMSVKLDKHTQ